MLICAAMVAALQAPWSPDAGGLGRRCRCGLAMAVTPIGGAGIAGWSSGGATGKPADRSPVAHVLAGLAGFALASRLIADQRLG